MKNLSKDIQKRVICTIILLLICSVSGINAQGLPYSYFYRVYFRDKGENLVSGFKAEDLLSPRAVSRRQKSGIDVPDFRDLPVSKAYIDKISTTGCWLHTTSKWMNSALFKAHSPVDINIILRFPFVAEVKIVKSPGEKSSFSDKLFFQTEQSKLPPFDRPVSMVNGYPIHNSGFNGSGIIIAVLDGGFTDANQISSLKNLRNRKGLKATYDFVENTKNVYAFSNHGTAVLSVLAGNINGSLMGTAPGADYLLLRTEDTGSEFPCEEDYWAAGAEFADSTGADIISSSLGYYNFDDSSLDYKDSDLDGNTAFITKVADIASSKGILVVNSAGNERNKLWQRITFPSDGDSVLAVGAVDGNNVISDFSSAGPSADSRVKPDNTAMGVSIPVQTDINIVERANGTSFACPVISGMAACLQQAVPHASNIDILNALRSCGDRTNSADSLYGYGIPDIVAALYLLQDKYIFSHENESIANPNPTTGAVDITFKEPPQSLIVEIISVTGQTIFKRVFYEYAGRSIRITELAYMDQGIYFIRLTKGDGIDVHKIIRVNN
jgi:hypothetical protein